MSGWLVLLLSGLGGWLIGSIPFSLLIARWGGGIDLRAHGSGNVGATNVTRLLGWRWGAAALLLDVAKGAAATGLIPLLLPVSADDAVHQQVLCGTTAILGHMFPPWLGFRGGKGVATGLGVGGVLAPWSMLAALGVFAVLFGLSRIVSFSSLAAALAFAVVQVAVAGDALWSREQWTLGAFSIGVPLLILLRHRSNLVRLWRGEEKQLFP